MFIVTNREVDESRSDLSAFGSRPNALGPNELRLAEATRRGRTWRVRILPDQITTAMAAEVGLEPEVDPTTGASKPIYASRYVARKLLMRVNPSAANRTGARKNLVLFVHGFNNDVKAVLDRAEEMASNYDVEVVPFTWPANGGGAHGVASYKSDKRDALASTGALDRVLARMHEYLAEIHAEHVRHIELEADRRYPDDAEKWDRFFSSQAERSCPISVSMALHSMGNYLFKHLLKSSTYRGNLLIFDNVLVIAADTNSAGHSEWVNDIQCRGRVFITINEKDGALLASRLKMGEQQKARLGHYPYGLTAQRAVYVDFSGEPHVGDSHAYFEGGALRNARVRRFFAEAFNGQAAETRLHFDIARNMYRFRA